MPLEVTLTNEMYNKALNNIKIYLFLATVIGHLAITTLISAQEQEGVLGSKRKVPFALRGDLYFLEAGTLQLPDFSELKRKGTIYAKELNVTPRSFREGFPGVTGRFEWFAIDYKGNFWIKEPGRYKFRLTSDDGAILFIDGINIIDNDGVHPPRLKENSIDLRQGLHKIRVKYFQGPASEIALVLEMAKETGEYSIFSPEQMTHFSQYNWLEVLMETTTLIVTFALLAFMVERLTNGIVILLGYWRWWRLRMEVPTAADPDKQSRIDRNRKVSFFALSALLAVAGSILTNIDLLAQLGFANLPGLGGQIVTGLLVASGADPIRELIKDRSLRRQDSSPPSTPIQVTGTVVLQQDATSETQKAKLES